MSRPPLLLKDQRLTRSVTRYDLQLTWTGEVACEARVLLHGEVVAVTPIDLFPRLGKPRIASFQHGRHVFFSAVEWVRFGIGVVWYIEPETLRLKELLRGDFTGLEHLSEGVVGERTFAKYAFGFGAIPKGAAHDTVYERKWRFDTQRICFHCVSEWKRVR